MSLRGDWDDDPDRATDMRKRCPVCGFPMQFRYKRDCGLRLYICTNEPELCGFMTNEYKAGALQILKCDSCRDGYLIAKKKSGSSEYMLGCTNYKRDGTGCSRALSAAQYYKMIRQRKR